MLVKVQRACALAVLLLLTGTAQAPGQQADSVEELLRQGRAQREAKEWSAAEVTFRQALESDPVNLTAHDELGLSLYGQGKYQEALDWLSKALELAPTNAVVRSHAGCCHYALGDFQKATASFRYLLASSPTNAEGHYWLSRSLCGAGNHAEAEASIRRAIALGAPPAHYYDQLGLCLSPQKRYREAIAAHQQALALDSGDDFALLQVGACCYQSGAYREAVAPLERFTKSNPKHFYGFYYLGHSYLELRQFGQAVSALQAAHALDPDEGFTRLGLFLAYMATGQYPKASGLYPFVYTVGGVLLTLGYGACLAGIVAISFKRVRNMVPPVIARMPPSGSAVPPLLSDCQAIPPLLPGLARAATAAGDSAAPDVAHQVGFASAGPGVWFALGWLVVILLGNLPWALLLGLLPSFHGAGAVVASMGAAAVPLIVVAATVFCRRPWGAPYRWSGEFPSVKLLVLGLLGLLGIGLFELGYTHLVEWITHKPFPAQLSVTLIRDALQTNPVTVVLSVAILAPIAEELVFRGLLFGALSRWFSARWTIISTAIIFSLIHMQASFFIPLFLVGLLCGWARHKSGTMALPMLLHVLNNGASILLLQLFPEMT